MVWTKAYTSTDGVSLTDTADTMSVLDEYFDTWLVSKGWSTSKFLSGSNSKYYYAAKNVSLFGGSTKRFGICLEYDYTTTAERFYQYHFGSGHTPSAAGPSTSVYENEALVNAHTGQWNFWTDTADSDCFAVITNSGKVIAFWPPEDSLVATVYDSSRAASEPSQPITPYLVNSISSNHYFYDTYNGASRLFPMPVYNNFNNTLNVPASFFNYGFIKGSGEGMYMYDTSGRTATYVQEYEGNSTVTNIDSNSGTLQVGASYYIRLGGSNSILLNCGTTDPGV